MSQGVARAGAAGHLDPATAALVRLAAAVAEGDVPELHERLVAALAAEVPPLWIDELLLQSMLVVGYPLALVAFGVWREVRGSAPTGRHTAEPLTHEDWQAWADRGAAVCRDVYGRAYHKLLVSLRALHPALEDLVLVDAYGKVIGRPGLDLRRRELATVAAIAVLGTAQQLHSHLRGALNTGASVEQVEAVLELVGSRLDPELRRRAWEQWEDVRRRKL
jgi:4-carboxymuconolactone decarboxylase